MPPLSHRPLLPLALPGRWHLVPVGKGVEREGSREDKEAGVGAPIHSRARTRSVVIRVPTRMINEAFWGPGEMSVLLGAGGSGGQGLVPLPEAGREWIGGRALSSCLRAKPGSPLFGYFPSEPGFHPASGVTGWGRVNTRR